MTVLVCGGRDYGDRDAVFNALDALWPTAVVHGGARGADAFAAEWARQNNVAEFVFQPDWEAHGKAAGPIRNQAMLDRSRPHVVLAFPGGKGTADMVKRAEAAGVPVRHEK